MIQVEFVTRDNEKVTAQADPGSVLLDVAQAAGMPLEGACEGQMACSTCHVVIAADWFARLPSASDEEEDMLDLAAGVTRCSRLSCQIVLTPDLDGIAIHIPEESRDMQTR